MVCTPRKGDNCAAWLVGSPHGNPTLPSSATGGASSLRGVVQRELRRAAAQNSLHTESESPHSVTATTPRRRVSPPGRLSYAAPRRAFSDSHRRWRGRESAAQHEKRPDRWTVRALAVLGNCRIVARRCRSLKIRPVAGCLRDFPAAPRWPAAPPDGPAL